MSTQDIREFPPKGLHLESVVALIGRANACLSRYDGLLESLVNPEVLLSPLIMKEAELSSRIEGTIATANGICEMIDSINNPLSSMFKGFSGEFIGTA